MDNAIEDIYRAAQVIARADFLVISVGAGMGVDSGLPDFRGNQGFWKAYPPIADLGISFTDMANPFWFEKRPTLAWAFYGHRLNLYRKTIPHKGFGVLKKWAESKPNGYFVFTSNVDGQFQKAGFDSLRIEEVHGSIHHFQCTIPCTTDIWEAPDENIEIDMDMFQAKGKLPTCPHCGALARPNILMFSDWNWLYGRSEQQAERMKNQVLTNRNTDLEIAIIEIGAGKAVPTVRMKSQRLAKERSTTLIRINPRDCDVPADNICVKAGALEGILAIDKVLREMS